MSFVIVDTEYTTWPGALESGWSLQGQHREVVQIAAIKVDGGFKEAAAFDVLVVPTFNPILSDLFIKLTGITQKMVDDAGRPFVERQSEFFDFCDGGNIPIICMNADEAVFRENCRLNKIDFPFVSSWHRLRPHLEQQGIDLTGMSSGDLHKLTPEPLSLGHTHYALHDVRSMGRWLQYAKTANAFSVNQLPAGAPDFDPRSRKPDPLQCG